MTAARVMRLALAWGLLAPFLPAAAQTAPARTWPVKPAEKTVITTAVDGAQVVVTVDTSEAPVDLRNAVCDGLTHRVLQGATSAGIHVAWPGRIRVNVCADLSDISTIAVAGTPARLVLTLNGGDTVNSYIATLIFDGHGLVERPVYWGIDPADPAEISHYHRITIN